MNKTPFGFTGSDLIAAVRKLEAEQIHPRTLARWAHYGLVVPSARPGRIGRGNGARYTLNDLHRARLVVRLLRAGFTVQRVRFSLAFVENELADVLRPRTKARLIVAGIRAYIDTGTGPVVQVPSGQYALPLAEVALTEWELKRLVA
jgi:DNA-binding transcriptional MerR regulator